MLHELAASAFADYIKRILGLSGGGGGGAGFSEKVNVEARMCHILPDDGSVDLNSIVLCQPLTVGRHAMNSSGIADYTGLNILVLGGGPVGIAIILNLRAKGVGVGLSGRVFVSELSTKRCEMIERLQLSNDLLNPLNDDVAKECRERTNGRGVDVVFDAAGVEAAMLAGMESLKLRGTYVNVAGWTEPFQIPMK
jgi:(R,R)-butanediol dehydrogenase/meso-butanediol dehydrogenase/diacetyl reductase